MFALDVLMIQVTHIAKLVTDLCVMSFLNCDHGQKGKGITETQFNETK